MQGSYNGENTPHADNYNTANINNGFKTESGKQTKTLHKLQSYREPGDPQSAEIVYIEKKKLPRALSAIIAAYIISVVILAIGVALCSDKVAQEIMLILLGTAVASSVVFYGAAVFIDTFFLSKRRKARCTYPVTAKIVDLREIRTDSGNTHYYPVYKFCYADKIYIFDSKRTAKPDSIGNTVEMFVNRNNPDDYYLADDYSVVSGVI
ncbi:MAG: DUF3592 domain-containing protein, partial [Acutalibacteraceae bacterium]|nr:DUF3592 domain-containing protein [Acutalibacteraceae bacterium]